MPKLTKTLVEKAEIKDKPYFIFDEMLPGFSARISPSGKRHYYLQYMNRKKVKRITLGQHGVITAEDARDKAITTLAAVKGGADPHEEKMLARLEPLVSDLAERYMEEHVAVHCKKSTLDGYRRYLDKHILPALGALRVKETTRNDIANLHHSLRKTPYEANRCLEVLSKMFNLAEMWGLRPDGTNPRKHIKKYKTTGRERYLTKQEALTLGSKLDEIKRFPDENLSAVYCIQLLLLTGCRLGEILTLKWDYIDRDMGVLKLPDSKTGAKLVYVGHPVFNLFDEIWNHPARPRDNPYVIWGQKPGCHLNNIQRPWRRFRKQANLDDLRIHDLRHSFASFAVSQGMSLPTIGKLLGHTQVQTTARYAHLMSEPLIAAATDVTNELGNLIGIDTTAKPKIEKTEPLLLPGAIPGTNIIAPVYLTSDQAAEYLGEDQRLLENWRWRKVGPRYTKKGNRIRYELEDLKSYKEQSKKAA